MATKETLGEWVLDALRAHGGEAKLVDVAKYIWHNHEEELRSSGNLFYTWQYDFRWSATQLRKQGRLGGAINSNRGLWSLKRPSA